MTDYRNWILTEDAHVAILTLNRPESNNSLDSETLYELRDICEYLRPKNDVWVIVLQGQGDHFSSGFVPELIREGLDRPEEEVREMMAEHQACLAALENIEKPAVAKIQGFCIGGGFIMTLCCDFRIASQRTLFSLPEVRLGIPIAWGTHRITRVAGVATAKRLILLADRLRAKDALALGLVHEVASPDKLEYKVTKLVSRLLKMPPRTLGVTKQIINASAGRLAAGTEVMELEAVTELLTHPDSREAVESYLEGRPPRFTG